MSNHIEFVYTVEGVVDGEKPGEKLPLYEENLSKAERAARKAKKPVKPLMYSSETNEFEPAVFQVRAIDRAGKIHGGRYMFRNYAHATDKRKSYERNPHIERVLVSVVAERVAKEQRYGGQVILEVRKDAFIDTFAGCA